MLDKNIEFGFISMEAYKNKEIERLLLENGAAMVGFAKIDELLVDLDGPRSEDSVTGPIDIPHYPIGISIILALPKEVIRGIGNAPTMEYYDAYHNINHILDHLAILCAEYIKKIIISV